ncbi:MAG: short-chain dehydrogenase [Deltaproteobacteria bacterium]|nr:MAG: short-chain dehydrogenase [Deltaproteobacteria bacterium]
MEVRMKGKRFEGEVVLITGSTRGIGRALAEAFSREGAKVVINGRDAEGAERVAEEIRKGGGEAEAVGADIADPQAVKELIRRGVEAFGGIDVLVNNAGVSLPPQPAEEVEPHGLDKIMAVNLKGAFLCSREVFPVMRERGGGRIVNVSSQAGLFGEPGLMPYCVSKAALLCLTRCLAYEWAPYGIRVNAVAPGFVAGGMNEPVLRHEALVNTLSSRVPLKRFARVHEVVEAVLFLAMKDSYVNGEVLVVDGGMSGYRTPSILELVGKGRKKRKEV